MQSLVTLEIALGCQFVMAAVSIFMFAMSKRRFFAYYACGIFLLALELLLNRVDSSVEPFLKWGSIHMAVSCSTLFLGDLFRTSVRHQSWAKTLQLVGIFHFVLSIACLLTPYHFILTASETVGFITLIGGCSVAIFFARKGIYSGMFVAAGVFILSFALVVEVWSGYNPLQSNYNVLFLLAVISGSLCLLFSSIVVFGRQVNELQQMRLEAAHANRLAALGELASSVAHEIKNPVAAIQYANELQTSLLTSPEANKAKLETIASSMTATVVQIQKILSSLDAVSRRADLDRPEYTMVGSMIQKALELCNHRLSEKNIDLVFKKNDADIEVNCREGQICQVLINLINNAIDAIEGNTSPWIGIDVKLHDSTLTIGVEDSGHGISKETLPNIYKSFFTTKGKDKGTGLGLNICQRIMNLHRGSVAYIENAANTRFEISLPNARHVAKT